MAEATVPTAGPLSAFDGIPGFRMLFMLGGLALSIALGVTAAFWFAEPTYSMLYSNISDREAGEVVDILRGSGIPHQLDNKSGAILVAEDKIHDARLQLAAQGLPRGTGFGLEIIGGETGFSTSQAMEKARYHHAVETELARTIGNLRPVQYARVHIADTKSTVFLRNKQRASASIFLSLFPGRSLEKSQVMSVVHLVASSVPNLEANNVTVVDQNGQLLNSPGEDAEFVRSGREIEQVRQIENTYVQRIENIISPMLGQGRVRATVTAQVDFTTREETTESFNRDNAAVRSEQVAENRQTAGSATDGGVPGALSNQPPPSGAEAQTVTKTGQAVSESTKSIRNFELDRTLSHTRQPTGLITRLSVAVVVDDKRLFSKKGKMTRESLTSDELENIDRLVKDAVGYDEARGDTISISNIAFFAEPDLGPIDDGGFLAGISMLGLVKQIVGALLVLAIAFGIVRPLLRNLSSSLSAAGTAVVASQPPPMMSAGSSQGRVAAAAPVQAAGPLSYEDKMSVARQAADKDPERVAEIVRSWVQTDG